MAAPLLTISLRRRVGRGKEIADRLPERRGIDNTPRPAGLLLWMHAASVGETMSILPVLSALAQQAPDVTTLLTTGTVTSAALLDMRLRKPGQDARILHRFVPLDVPLWVGRFLDHWRPDAACFVESEIWPNMLRACHHRGIPRMLANARMSARSFGAWQRVPALAQHLLAGFTLIQARGAEDAERLRRLGATHVETPGDLKFAAPPLPFDAAELARLRVEFAGRPVWVAASTHPGEEPLVAEAHERVAATYPNLVTIVVPRHPDRGPAVAAELAAPRRGAAQPPPAAGLWVADTLGEMGLWFRLAPIAFIGRSLLAPGGGQNPLEPARLGCAIAVGPYTANFTDHVALLRDAGALVQIADPAALADFVQAMLEDEVRRNDMGQRAMHVAQRHETLPQATAHVLLGLMRGR